MRSRCEEPDTDTDLLEYPHIQTQAMGPLCFYGGSATDMRSVEMAHKRRAFLVVTRGKAADDGEEIIFRTWGAMIEHLDALPTDDREATRVFQVMNEVKLQERPRGGHDRHTPPLCCPG